MFSIGNPKECSKKTIRPTKVLAILYQSYSQLSIFWTHIVNFLDT